MINHIIRPNALGLPLKIQDQSMTQGLMSHGAKIVAGNVVPVIQNCSDFGSQDQGLGPAGT